MDNKKTKLRKRVSWLCGFAVLLLINAIVVIYVFNDGTVRPFKDLKSEEIKSVQVTSMGKVLHNMTEEEIEELVEILVHVTHNEYAEDYEPMMGGGLSCRFVLEYHDGRTITVAGSEQYSGCYVAIDSKPYHDRDGTSGRRLASLHDEYYEKWLEKWYEEHGKEGGMP